MGYEVKYGLYRNDTAQSRAPSGHWKCEPTDVPIIRRERCRRRGRGSVLSTVAIYVYYARTTAGFYRRAPSNSNRHDCWRCQFCLLSRGHDGRQSEIPQVKGAQSGLGIDRLVHTWHSLRLLAEQLRGHVPE